MMKLKEIKRLLDYCSQYNIKSVTYGDFSAEFSPREPQASDALSTPEELQAILDRAGDLSPSEYKDVLYHSASF